MPRQPLILRLLSSYALIILVSDVHRACCGRHAACDRLRSNLMSKVSLAILFLCLPILVLAQTSATSPRYQPATIIAVSPHQSAGDSAPGDTLYDVSVKVSQTLYVVVTTSPPPSGSIQYTVGREVMVRVSDDTITWNDILGQSHDVPIISRSPVAASFKSQH